MCGRFTISASPDAIRKFLGYAEKPNFPPRYNVAPTQPVPIVRLENGARRFVLVRWGLIPSWVKDPREFSLLINARAEGILEKPSFGAAMKRRRCLVPADGFYEWQKTPRGKRPFYIRARGGGPMVFAGLWELWTDRDGGELESMVIVTCPANQLLAPIHDRMPAILPPKDFDAWLDAEKVDAKAATALLQPAPEKLLEAYEISTRVNSVRNDGPELIAPVASG
jgi:putative SOS response-associated peptidase YedK